MDSVCVVFPLIQGPLYTALTRMVHDCRNFKVRINAAVALEVPRERHHYGNPVLYSATWESLIKALRVSANATDFAEYKYQDNLVEQVSLMHTWGDTACHTHAIISQHLSSPTP